MTSFHYPYFTAAAGVVLAVLQMILALYVAGGRGRYRAGLGDGGNEKLLQRIRAHGNLAENAPLFLILLALVETTGQWSAQVPYFAAVFVVARLLHALGLLSSSGTSLFRLLGILGTIGVILGLCGLLVRTLTMDTHWLATLPHLGA